MEQTKYIDYLVNGIIDYYRGKLSTHLNRLGEEILQILVLITN
jgi:hypothetical protein